MSELSAGHRGLVQRKLSAEVSKEHKMLGLISLQIHHLIIQGLSFPICQRDMTTLVLLTPLSL